METTKEIILKASFPKEFDHLTKMGNVVYYIKHPEDIDTRDGIILLRNPDDMGRDEEEIRIQLRKESLTIKGMSYKAPQILSGKHMLKDKIEIVLDLFIWDPININFFGISAEKRMNFTIPSYYYSFMVNLRIDREGEHIHTKVFYECKNLHRNQTNFAKVYREKESKRGEVKVDPEPCATLGLYVI